MNWFTLGYLVLGAALLTLELVGVWRKQRGDTISELWWKVQRRAPILARLWMGGALIWLFVHFLTHT